MVSPQNEPVAAGVATDLPRNDRGIIEEHSVSTLTPAGGTYSLTIPRYTTFWGSVIAGTLLAIGIAIMSYALMFGCHVGTYANGVISLGWGAAVWIVVTACIAYFFGGMFSACLSASGPESGAFRGLSVWGLSVPLVMVIASLLALGSGVAYGATQPAVHEAVAQTATNLNAPNLSYQGGLWVPFGGAWTVFLSLILGLFCAWIGGSIGRGTLERSERKLAS